MFAISPHHVVIDKYNYNTVHNTKITYKKPSDFAKLQNLCICKIVAVSKLRLISVGIAVNFVIVKVIHELHKVIHLAITS